MKCPPSAPPKLDRTAVFGTDGATRHHELERENMPRELTNPPELHPTPGFSHIAEAKGGRLVMFAGQVALDAEFNIVGGDDLYEQTKAAMRNVEVAVRAAGVSWGDIVRRTIYTTTPHDFETIARAIHEVTGDAEDPPQTIVGVTGLALPGLLIEIECTATA
jgi:enamine deaminase RidA (YjgF/YER057c/UK114 family)